MAFKIMSFKEFTDMKNAQEAPEEPEVAETPEEMPKTGFIDFIRNRKTETKFDIRSSDEIEEFLGCEPKTEESPEQDVEDVENADELISDELVSDECSDCEPEESDDEFDDFGSEDVDPETEESVECSESAECPEQDCDEQPDADADIVEVDFTGI